MSRPPQGMPPGRTPTRPGGREQQGWPRGVVWVLIGLLTAVVLLPYLFSSPSKRSITYSQFISDVQAGKVESVGINNDSGRITGTFNDNKTFQTTGPQTLPDKDVDLLKSKGVQY